jgi:hypothetical protein
MSLEENVHPESGLQLFSHLSFAVIGLIIVWRGLSSRAMHRSLIIGMRGQPVVPMGMGLRIVKVVVGTSLAVLSTLLALGVVK